MKLARATALALPFALASVAAQASYGPDITQPETTGHHLTELAWLTISQPKGPGCTDPTPTDVVFACAVDTFEK